MKNKKRDAFFMIFYDFWLVFPAKNSDFLQQEKVTLL
jgi:hypothetical protein